jgi:hypothetical protein
MRLLLVTLFSLIVVASAVAQTRDGLPANRLIVQVGAFNVRPDGSIGGYAVETGEVDNERLVGGIATDGCRVGAGDSWIGAGMPAWAPDGWEIRGRVETLAADRAAIQLDWKRVRSAGAAVEQALESRALTLPLDQFVPLDEPVNNPRCAPNSVVFGARYAHRFPSTSTLVRATPARSGGVAAGGSGVAAGATVYSAELWLVRRAPGTPESVVSTAVRVANGVSAFEFVPMRVSVPGGTLVVHVNGQLQILRVTDSQPVLVFDAKRDATFTPSNRPPRDAAGPDPEGRASVTRPLPGPDDVLEFEMPPIALPGVPAPPGTFAVRLRLTPAKGMF